MASNSLIESYAHVVYENKKVLGKLFFEKYFSSDQKTLVSKFLIFLKIQEFLKILIFQNIFFFQKRKKKIVEKFSSIEKYFSENFFSKLFLFS